MPLYTVANCTYTSRVLVCKGTVQDVIAAAVAKFKLQANLADEDYKIVLARNGAEIDEDEVLLALLPDSELVLLPPNSTWSVAGGTTQPQPQQPPQQSRETPPGTNQQNPNFNPIARPLLSFPVHTIRDFEEKMDSGKRLTPLEQKLIIHSVANHMAQNKDFTRTTCDRFSRSLTSKYPAAFEIRDADDNLLSNGGVSLLTRLYERLNTIKPKSLMRKRTRREAESETENADDVGVVWVYELSEKHDSYGCVAWEPELPDDETNETQEEKRLELQELCVENDADNALKLFKLTYSTQRRAINRRRGALQTVIDDWKYMNHRSFFMWHASTLLGKEILEVWQRSIDSKALPLFNLFKYKLLSKSVSGATKKAFEKADTALESGEEASLNQRMDTPRIVALFPCVLFYFKEDPNLIFKEIDKFSNVDEIKGTHGQVDRPLLLVKGNLYDDTSRTTIVCEGEILHEDLTVLDGFLFLFLSYYVYNYRYHDSARGFMEFLQRMLLQINPTVRGHKRGPKAPRRSDLDPRVKKLSLQLAEHLNHA